MSNYTIKLAMQVGTKDTPSKIEVIQYSNNILHCIKINLLDNKIKKNYMYNIIFVSSSQDKSGLKAIYLFW